MQPPATCPAPPPAPERHVYDFSCALIIYFTLKYVLFCFCFLENLREQKRGVLLLTKTIYDIMAWGIQLTLFNVLGQKNTRTMFLWDSRNRTTLHLLFNFLKYKIGVGFLLFGDKLYGLGNRRSAKLKRTIGLICYKSECS